MGCRARMRDRPHGAPAEGARARAGVPHVAQSPGAAARISRFPSRGPAASKDSPPCVAGTECVEQCAFGTQEPIEDETCPVVRGLWHARAILQNKANLWRQSLVSRGLYLADRVATSGLVVMWKNKANLGRRRWSDMPQVLLRKGLVGTYGTHDATERQ